MKTELWCRKLFWLIGYVNVFVLCLNKAWDYYDKCFLHQSPHDRDFHSTQYEQRSEERCDRTFVDTNDGSLPWTGYVQIDERDTVHGVTWTTTLRKQTKIRDTSTTSTSTTTTTLRNRNSTRHW
eukprot:5026043-Amphidinium_carterae.2